MIRYRVLPDHELVVLCLWGSTSAQEILEMSEALGSEPDFSGSYDTLVDNSRLETPLSGEEMRELATPKANFMDSQHRVAVVAPSAATYGTTRMYQQITEYATPTQVGVFRDYDSALAWLDREGLDAQGLCEELVRGR